MELVGFSLSKCFSMHEMPTTPRRARLWLKTERACVVSREPFAIQLRFTTTTHTQSGTVGVDAGSKTVGLAATVNREAVFRRKLPAHRYQREADPATTVPPHASFAQNT